MAQTGLVFLGIAGNVVALDRVTGEEVWRTRLKGDFVNVVQLESDLYATAAGELFCLDPTTGRVRWQNPLKGLGRGMATIAVPGGQQTIVIREKRQQDEAASAAATSIVTG